MKANKLSAVVYTDKNLPADKIKNCFIHVDKNIIASIIQEVKNSFSFLKDRRKIASFISMLILCKFKFCYIF